MVFEWKDFVAVLNNTKIEFPHLKKVQLAQAILESGRGQSNLFKLHANPFGMKYRPEMSQIAIPVTYQASDGEDTYCQFDNLQDAVDGYWLFIDRPIYSGWRTSISSAEDYIDYIAHAGYIGGDKRAKQEYINKVVNLFSEASILLGNSPSQVSGTIWQQNGVLLEVGHGRLTNGVLDPGVVGVNSKNEYELNWIAAKAAQTVIRKAGIPCEIIDVVASLYNIGQRADGYDVFCSIHHNSAAKAAQGTEVLVHHGKASPEDLMLSQIMSASIATELGITDRIANGRNPRQRLAVLSGAKDTDVRASVLAEIYFIHVPVPNVIDWSQRGGQAVGRAIINWLKPT